MYITKKKDSALINKPKIEVFPESQSETWTFYDSSRHTTSDALMLKVDYLIKKVENPSSVTFQECMHSILSCNGSEQRKFALAHRMIDCMEKFGVAKAIADPIHADASDADPECGVIHAPLSLLNLEETANDNVRSITNPSVPI